jgi:STE24 endopeptidase
MNAYGVIVLAALLADHGLSLASDVLTLRGLQAAPPDALRDVYPPERWRRVEEYTRARVHLSMTTATARLGVVLAFWFLGGFPWLDRWARGFGLGPITTGLLFLGALGAMASVLALPARWYSTFVIEERFGFNRTTAATFWADAAKGMVLAVLIGGPVLAAILWLFERADGHPWLWSWLACASFLVALQLVAPAWILPLFLRFAPLREGGLRDAILRYARAVGFPLEDVYVIDGSRRSTKANAFFTGIGRHKRVALFDTLVEKLADAEVLAVVAHEVGHHRCGHVVKATLLGILQVGVLLALFSVVVERRGLFEAFYVGTPSVHVGLVLFGLLAGPLELALGIAVNAWSRRNEREADRFAVETTGSGAALARALVALAGDGLANPTPHPLDVVLHHAHPPVLERLAEIGS